MDTRTIRNTGNRGATMNTKNAIGILAILGMFVLSASAVAANIEPGGATVTDVVNYSQFPPPSADDITVEAGLVYSAVLESTVSTFRWAGLFGNVSGTIVLGDADQNRLFDWTGGGNLVFASEAATPDWSELANATIAQVTGEYPHLAGDAADNYTNTFSGNENIGSNIFNLESDFALSYDQSEDPFWKTYSLWDGTDVVFAGRVDTGQSYRDVPSDFQMLLPQDGSATGEASTEYNLWVELI